MYIHIYVRMYVYIYAFEKEEISGTNVLTLLAAPRAICSGEGLVNGPNSPQGRRARRDSPALTLTSAFPFPSPPFPLARASPQLFVVVPPERLPISRRTASVPSALPSPARPTPVQHRQPQPNTTDPSQPTISLANFQGRCVCFPSTF